ncbi:MAG: hypothetical protein IJ664_07905 [Clostridia bacterium]|nr:hypothetical protein [Clostridia bacterium]
MKKHRILWIVLAALVVCAALVYVLWGRTYLRRHFRRVSVDRQAAVSGETVDLGDRRAIAVYFTRVGNSDFDSNVDVVSSASLMEDGGQLIGNAELIADMIVQATGCDSYAIRVVEHYASSYGDTVKQAGAEIRSDEFRMLAGNAPDLSAYDTVFLVHPLWWGSLPEPVVTFLMGMDLTGKTVYNVVTHGGSGLGQAVIATRAYTQAEVSDKALAILDDDAVNARPQVTEWLKGL